VGVLPFDGEIKMYIYITTNTYFILFIYYTVCIAR